MSAIALTNYRSREAAAALFFPGFELPSMPSADDIRSAREAAGIPLREWARLVEGGPSHNFWNQIENGKKGEKHLRKLSPEVIDQVKKMVAKYRKK